MCTETLWASREGTQECPRGLCLLGVGSWQMGTAGFTWVPCLEPAPFKPYITIRCSGLCRQLPNSYVYHLVVQSSAEIIRRPILIKSLIGAGTLCLWLSSRTYWEPAVAQPRGPDLRGDAGVGERLHGLSGWLPPWETRHLGRTYSSEPKAAPPKSSVFSLLYLGQRGGLGPLERMEAVAKKFCNTIH